MFIKKAQFFSYKKNDETGYQAECPTLEQLESVVEKYADKEPDSKTAYQMSFVPVVGDDRIIVKCTDAHVLRVRVVEKKVPPAMLRKALSEWISNYEIVSGNSPTNDEKFAAGETVRLELTEQAFPVESQFYLVFAPDCVISTGSSADTDYAFNCIRDIIGTLPLVALVKSIPSEQSSDIGKSMLLWVTDDDVAPFSIGNEVVVQGTDKRVAKFSNGLPDSMKEPLDSIRGFAVKSAQIVSEDNGITFKIDNKLGMSAIRVHESKLEGVDDEVCENDDIYAHHLATLIIELSAIRGAMLDITDAL